MTLIRNSDGLNAGYLGLSDLEKGVHNFPRNVFMSLKYLAALSQSGPLDMKVVLKHSDLTES